MKALKILAGVIIVLAILIGIGTYLLLSNINDIVKYAVEEGGTSATKTEVTLSSADVSVSEGRGELNLLSVANPAGFSADNIFSLDKIVLDVDPQSLTKDVIVVDEVTIDGVKILAELKGLTETNIAALLDNLDQGSGSEEASPSAESESDSSEEPLLAVKKLVFSNSQLALSSDEFGSLDLSLPSFELSNLGSAENGLTPTQLAKAAIEPLLEKAQDAVEDELKEKVKDKAEEKIKSEIEDRLKDKVSEEDLEKLKGLKSLFKKD